jgi:molybdopterin/thiamine biosynthesis adenylyltransferase/proteasome lid subunit RPN8/RPN11
MIKANKVLIHKNALQKTEEEKIWGEKGLESGCYGVGKIHPNFVYEITDFIDAGPNAVRNPASFSPDNKYAEQRKAELQKEKPDLRLLCEYHIHPGFGVYPSGGDIHQLKEIKSSTRYWYIMMLGDGSNFKFWDIDKEENLVEVPYQVLQMPENAREELLSRISKIVQSQFLAKKSVAIIGLGSGGSVISKYLGLTGIGRLVLIDNEELEFPNLIRHEGTIGDIGRPKSEICQRAIESHNPFTIVETHMIDALKEQEKLAGILETCDLVIGATGGAKVNNLINKISLKLSKPAVYGGVFEKATGGYVLAVQPGKTACFNCAFELASQGYAVDENVSRNYGTPIEELHAQQGLWVDISLPALMVAKFSLTMLQEPDSIEKYNFLSYKNSFSIQRAKIEKRQDCAACNFEGWIEHMEKILKEPEKPVTRAGFFSRLWRR